MKAMPLFRTAAALFILAGNAAATHLTTARLNKVFSVMQKISRQSWENGTEAEAILEYQYPQYSVFSNSNPYNALTPPPTLGDISLVFDIAQFTMDNRPPTNSSAAAQGGSSLLQDDAAGDPASLGVSILLVNRSTSNAQVSGVGFGDAATSELEYLLYDVPRTSSGAISHRADQAQLWSDSVFMVPPFIAYYGALTANQTLLQIAHDQCSLYRSALRQSNGLWKHIVDGTGNLDPGQWATGNAWAAMGMLRVLATIKWSQFAGDMGSQMSDLQSWVEEILTGSDGYIDSSGLLHNYINDSSTFLDSASSALMAAAGIRLSTLNLTNAHLTFALDLLSAVSSKVNSSGYLTQVVNPQSFPDQGTESPEGQSFVVMAYAAYNDWVKMGQPGDQGNDTPLGSDSGEGRAMGMSTTALIGVAIVSLWVLL